MHLTKDLKIRKELINIHSIANVVNYMIKDLIFYYDNKKIVKENDLNLSISLNHSYSINLREIQYNVKLNSFMLYDILNSLLCCYSSKMENIKTHLIIENTYNDYEILVDEIIINQIVINFLSNSVKFSRKGHIYILNKFVKIKKNLKKKYFLKISIIDTGIGINENNLKYLFKKGNEINNDYNSQGSELGLSICLSLTKISNLKIEYFSKENIGSIFSILIPVKKLKNKYRNEKNLNNKFNNSILYENRENILKKSKSQEYFGNLLNNNENKDNEKNNPIRIDLSKTIISNSNIYTNMNKRLLEKFEFVEPDIQFKRKENIINKEKEIEKTYLEFIKDDLKIFELVKNIRKSKSKNLSEVNYQKFDYYPSNDSYIWKYNYIESESKNNDSKVLNESVFSESNIYNINNINNSNTYFSNQIIKDDNNFINNNLNLNLNVLEYKICKAYNLSIINDEINIYENEKVDYSKNSNENYYIDIIENLESNCLTKTISSRRSEIENSLNSSSKSIFSSSYDDQEIKNNEEKDIKYDSFGPKILNEPILPKRKRNSIINNYNSNSKDFDDNLNFTKNNDVNIGIEDNMVFKYSDRNISDESSRKKSLFEKDKNSEIEVCLSSKSKIKSKLSNKEKKEIQSDRFSINSKSFDDSFVFLVIEDNVNIRNMQVNLLKTVLDSMIKTKNKNFEYKILSGEDGIDTLKYVIDPLLSSRIKTIFTDENMLFMNGSESIKIIRNLQKLSKISNFNICTVTAFEDKDTSKEIKFIGVDRVVKKPLSRNQLEEYFLEFPFLD
jgi:CheY-like chemotaxis protein